MYDICITACLIEESKIVLKLINKWFIKAQFYYANYSKIYGGMHMRIIIEESKVIKTQELDISDEVSIIYGYNNSGKTTILKSINRSLYSSVKKRYFNGQKSDISLYIPTNRVVISDAITEYKGINDLEDLINYEKNMLFEYDLHLKKIRDYLMKYEVIRKYIQDVIKKLFDMQIPIDEKLIIENKRYSDGIENIINIYINIIWILTWDNNINELDELGLNDILATKKSYILIDEIEMFLHVNIQSKLINSLKDDFKQCGFIFTTHSPLLLTRYRNSKVYNIDNGELNEINQQLFYEDLNRIFEEFFNVDELPDTVKNDINYLGDVIIKKANVNKEKINNIEQMLKKDFPSLYRKYNKTIVKAKYIGDKHV